MIHKSYIDTLKYLDDKQFEIITLNPYPITYYEDDNSEVSRLINSITEAKKQIVCDMARSLGLKIVNSWEER